MHRFIWKVRRASLTKSSGWLMAKITARVNELAGIAIS